MGHVGECPVQEYRLEFNKDKEIKNGVRNLLQHAKRYKKISALFQKKKKTR